MSSETWPQRSQRSGRGTLRVVIDTNVWVSALIRPHSSPGAVLEAVRSSAIEPIASWSLVGELIDVLRRPRIHRYGVTEVDIDDVAALVKPFLPLVEVDIEIRDPDDAVVVAAAIAGRASAIVTGDRDLLDDVALRRWLSERDVEVLTPVELVARI